jgi:hypothetical protein
MCYVCHLPHTIFFTDYVCNQADLEIIELIKKTLINLERNKLCSSMMLS